MKIKKVFFLNIIIVVFYTKIATAQYDYYPLVGNNYENNLKEMKSLFVVDPYAFIWFEGHRAKDVSLKRINRLEQKTKKKINNITQRRLKNCLTLNYYKRDSLTSIYLLKFLKKLTNDLDSINHWYDSLDNAIVFYKKIYIKNKIRIEYESNKFKEYKIHDTLPLSIDSNKKTDYILLTYFNGSIITGSASCFFNYTRGLTGHGKAYIFILNKKDKTVCYYFKAQIQSDIEAISKDIMKYALKKLKNDIKKVNLQK